jgi:long-chain acyl-CoA synthetase
MMFIDFLLDVFHEDPSRDAIVWRDRVYSYQDLLDRVEHWDRFLGDQSVCAGAIAVIEADFSPNAIALLLALVDRGCIIVPLTVTVAAKKAEFLKVARPTLCLECDAGDEVRLIPMAYGEPHELMQRLIAKGHPGLVLFSSGSTGKSKAAVHDLVGILSKFKVRRHARRAITFLLFDHIGGVNTLFYQLSNGGCVVTVQDRSADSVLHRVERFRVEMLPASPTFLNLILLSEAYQRHDLSSLKLITYGTEPMPQSTLDRFHALFPDIQMQQTYGLSELGILRSKSRASDSLWVRLGGEGFETRIVDGLLEVKAESAMLGYLNAPSPFTPDGWFQTGDEVDVDGDWLRIRGRRSEVINVGGEKVHPTEVESVIQQMDGVEAVDVAGERNAIMGTIVVARVKLNPEEPVAAFRRRMLAFCGSRLPRYAVPQKVLVMDESMVGERFKKIRRRGSDA